jgi:anthranilate phosphoribosyltransferase
LDGTHLKASLIMKKILEQLYHQEHLTFREAKALVQKIAQGIYTDCEIAALLSAYRLQSPSLEEILGFRAALQEIQIKIDLSAYQAIDIVGTGGDGKNTFNISTCACFVVAGAGYKVIKHGNYSSSSVCGASNVIENHGVKFSTEISKLEQSIEECGMAYLHAPCFNPGMKVVSPIRKAIGVRTFFNLLGPLINPSSPQYQLLGVADLAQMRLYAHIFQQLDLNFTLVNSLDGYDEISLTNDFKVITSHYDHIYSPEEIGLQSIHPQELYGGNTLKEATILFDKVLKNESSLAQQQCVIANAAFAIQTLVPHKTLDECIESAQESLKSGKAFLALQKFVALNQ